MVMLLTYKSVIILTTLLGWSEYANVIKNVFLELFASESSGKGRTDKMQTSEFHPKPAESDFLGLGSKTVHF